MVKNKCGGVQKFFKVAGGATADDGLSIASSQNRIFITGFVNGDEGTVFDFKGNEVTKTYGSNDIYVASLDRCGKQKFFKTAGGLGDDQGLNIDTYNENVYVTGFIDDNNAVDFKGKNIDCLSALQNIFVAGLDNCGCQVFFKTAGGNGLFNGGIELITCEQGIFITGNITGNNAIDFKGNAINNLGNNANIFVSRLDFKGNQKFFVTAAGPTGFGRGLGIDVNEKGCFITGVIGLTGATDFNGDQVITYGENDIFVSRLNLCGKQKFFKTAGNINFDQGTTLTVNSSGVYVGGLSIGQTAIDFNEDVVELKVPISNAIVAGLDFCGNQKFFNSAGGNNNVFDNNSIRITSNEKKIFATGIIIGQTALDFAGDEIVLKNDQPSSSDIFVAGFNNCGQQKFFKTAGGGSTDFGFDITNDDEHIYISGAITNLSGELGATSVDFKGNCVQFNPDFPTFGYNFISALDNMGKQKFFKTATPSGDFLNSYVTVTDKDLYTGGRFNATLSGNTFDFNGNTKPFYGNRDIFISRLTKPCVTRPQQPILSKMQFR